MMQNQPLRKLISMNLIWVSLIFSGCQTGVIISESNLSVSDHRKAIVAAIGEARVVSQNGRELSSYFHDLKFKYLEVTPTTKRRYYTKALILGARRPYDVAIEVHIEERDPDTNVFQDVGLDDDLGLVRAKAVREMLNQSRDHTHTIDGTNPF
ncbi:MAG: hypothetical protein H7061_03435 [Bdellovibrionaceae bacterium]|nr:hypothetical protein [Bdellovibrio sp.]